MEKTIPKMRFDIYCDECDWQKNDQPNLLEVHKPGRRHNQETGHSLTCYKNNELYSTIRRIHSLTEIKS